MIITLNNPSLNYPLIKVQGLNKNSTLINPLIDNTDFSTSGLIITISHDFPEWWLTHCPLYE